MCVLNNNTSATIPVSPSSQTKTNICFSQSASAPNLRFSQSERFCFLFVFLCPQDGGQRTALVTFALHIYWFNPILLRQFSLEHTPDCQHTSILSFVQVLPVFPLILPECCDVFRKCCAVMTGCHTAGVRTVTHTHSHTHLQLRICCCSLDVLHSQCVQIILANNFLLPVSDSATSCCPSRVDSDPESQRVCHSLSDERPTPQERDLSPAPCFTSAINPSCHPLSSSHLSSFSLSSPLLTILHHPLSVPTSSAFF